MAVAAGVGKVALVAVMLEAEGCGAFPSMHPTVAMSIVRTAVSAGGPLLHGVHPQIADFADPYLG